MANVSLYWHDYETFGADPRRDRPAQFAGIRTTEELDIIGDPLVLYCRPATDFLPAPEACLITGITPQLAFEKGIPEARFIAEIHRELSAPGTCGLGYNTLRFDDEITRHALYRNFFDPYEREWRNGNSRWDIIDLARLTAALRPDGLEWPRDAAGRPSFRLELLTAANGIAHQGAHDALADVRATIELARLIRQCQPKLYDYVWTHRGKQAVADLLQLGAYQPLLHVSEKYPAEKGCLAVVVALARHPLNPNGVVVYDLSCDPEPLLELDADAIAERLFTPTAELGEGVARIPLKTVHINKAPIVAPLKALRLQDADRLGLDLGACEAHLRRLREARGLAAKVAGVFDKPAPASADDEDPDLMLYRGGFFSDADKFQMARLREMDPETLAKYRPEFQDRRLPEMLFRYRARNYPETLDGQERERWDAYRRRHLTDSTAAAGMTFGEYEQRIAQLEAGTDLSSQQRDILQSLRRWGTELMAQIAAEPAALCADREIFG